MQNYLHASPSSRKKTTKILLSDNGVHFVVQQRPVSAVLQCSRLTRLRSPKAVVNSDETVALLSVAAGSASSHAASERLTVNDNRARLALAPQPITDPLVDGAGRRAGARCGPGPASRPTAGSCNAAAGTSTTRGRRSTRRSSRRGGRNLNLPTCLALSVLAVPNVPGTLFTSRVSSSLYQTSRVNNS